MGLGAGTDFAIWNAVISLVFCSKMGCNLERVCADDLKKSTDKDSFLIKQCPLRINPPTQPSPEVKFECVIPIAL